MLSSPSFMLVVALVCSVAAVTVPMVEGTRALFVFGDSLVDNGNNNFLVTSARADVPPYGIDYPNHRATGRFSNGYNIPDIISKQLGAESTMAYLDPRLHGKKLLVGANFASAGVGILNDTGYQFVNMLRMYRQLELFQEYQCRVSKLIGEERKKTLVGNGLVFISVGSNDFINNYYLTPITGRRLQYPNLEEYNHLLISEYKKILQKVYDLGARRVVVMGAGPLGCIPAMLASRSTDGNCATELQTASAIFNQQLVEMIRGLNQEIGSDVFTAVNTKRVQHDFLDNPSDYGFTTSKVACCGQGPYNGLGLCTEASHLCSDRSKYAFWDAYHPSEKANRIIVRIMFNGSGEYMMPVNLSSIFRLDGVAKDGNKT